MKFKAKKIGIFAFILVIVCCIGCERQNDDNESLQPDPQTTTKADITLTGAAIEKDISSTNPAIKSIPEKEQVVGASTRIIILSKGEIVSGSVSIGGTVGDMGTHTFTTEELIDFIDTVNSFNLTEKDCEGTPAMHTASSFSVNINLVKSNGARLIFSAFDDGETDFTDYQSGYNFFNKDFSDYIHSFSKYFYQVDTTTSESILLDK